MNEAEHGGAESLASKFEIQRHQFLYAKQLLPLIWIEARLSASDLWGAPRLGKVRVAWHDARSPRR